MMSDSVIGHPYEKLLLHRLDTKNYGYTLKLVRAKLSGGDGGISKSRHIVSLGKFKLLFGDDVLETAP